mmetsp:Transcript_39965/g.124531  ORF Transcript_39965/g.124531 Transcript_39965/m.124531 type:complete len:554 (-) Transcript_39965:583-2244(-)
MAGALHGRASCRGQEEASLVPRSRDQRPEGSHALQGEGREPRGRGDLTGGRGDREHRAPAVAREGHGGEPVPLTVRGGRATREETGLEQCWPLDLCTEWRGRLQERRGHGGCGGQTNLGVATPVPPGELPQQGQQVIQPFRDFQSDCAVVFPANLERLWRLIEGLQAPLHGLFPHAHSRPSLCASGADLYRLAVARLCLAVAGIAQVVRHARGADERRVRGTLVCNFDGVTDDEEDPGDEHGDEARLHVEPRGGLALAAQRAVHVLALRGAGRHDHLSGEPRVRSRAAAGAAGGAELARYVRLPRLQVLRGGDEPDGVLEGARQAPGRRPPRGSGRLCWLRRLRHVGGAEPDELDRVDHVDGIRDVDKDEGQHHTGGRVPALVLKDGSNVREPHGERTEALDGDITLVGDDVKREDDLLEDGHGEDHTTSGKDGAGLRHVVADLHVRPAVRQVHEGQEDAQTGVDVVRPPLVLDLAVDLEVLRRRAPGVPGQHGLHRLVVVDGLLLAVPRGHVVSMASAALRVRVQLHVLVVGALGAGSHVAVAHEGDAEGLG